MRDAAEHESQVVEGCKAGAYDGNVGVPQYGEGAAHGIMCGRIFGRQDGELDDGDVGGGIYEKEWYEDAVVPALKRLC